jgi:addiction module HigA family antidote
MGKKTIAPVHPGEYLKEIIDELGISQYRLALTTHIAQSHMSGIIRGRLNITAETALKIGKAFNQSAEFWLNLQRGFDLDIAEDAIADVLKEITPFDTAKLAA